jgi:hypothetical protein
LSDVDIAIIRENTEGEYSGLEHQVKWNMKELRRIELNAIFLVRSWRRWIFKNYYSCQDWTYCSFRFRLCCKEQP